MPLKSCFLRGVVEAGCDEAGRGCLAGPVYAAAVVLPPDFFHPALNDSKKLSPAKRYELRQVIEHASLCYAVASVDAEEIDRINILRASVKAMHLALEQLSMQVEHILVDGSFFYPYKNIPHTCVVHGDAIYMSIAAASVLAKTYRDDYMIRLHEEYPYYNWKKHKGYATREHRKAIELYGLSPYHRKTFLKNYYQLSLNL